MAHPTGKLKDKILKLDFDRRLLMQFRRACAGMKRSMVMCA
jgi:hypothetical protein